MLSHVRLPPEGGSRQTFRHAIRSLMRRNTFANFLAEGTDAWLAWQSLPRPERLRIGGWVAWIVVATLAFVQPLVALFQYASDTSLHSHAPLVPLVTGYLLFIQRRALPAAARHSIVGTLLMIACAAGALLVSVDVGDRLSVNDTLSLQTLSYVCTVVAGGFLFMGARWMVAAAFPMAFLIFMVPLPDGVVRTLEMASVQASADVAAWFFRITGTPMLRAGEVFKLPTIVIEVARECSGIRSSWVLFITSLVASHMLLTSTWRRVVLVAFVIPLGIVRNGFRILTIGLLCVYVGPHMIDSVIHHRGGPIFFLLSLIPLFLLVVWLRRGERSS
jgi:exosortase C (VPDSG-CTERM-specific)